MAEDTAAPMRLMNFVSQEQLDEAKSRRGERVEDGTAQRDRPLFEILKENKDRKDAEFNERFKHRPPKALDEDETDFLHHVESSRKHYEQQIAEEEAQQLRTFQQAVAAQSMIVQEVKEPSQASNVQDEKRLVGKKSQPVKPLGMIIKVKPHAKKPKLEPSLISQMGADQKGSAEVHQHSGQLTSPEPDEEDNQECLESPISNGEKVASNMTISGLVSYSDESDDD